MVRNQYCLITGATRGLGMALARTFWEAGANLVLVARHAADLDSVIVSLGARTGQKATALPADFADPAAAAGLVSTLRTKFPKLDVLINNAAIQGPIGPLWENDWGEWLTTLQVDLLSPIALCKSVAPWMIEQGGGSIINLSGGGATGPRPNFTAYATAKSALVRFSEILAEELRPYNVRVNCIAPGAMKTAMVNEVVERGATAGGQKEYTQALKVQQGGGASMQQVAQLCLFLVSDAARGISGKLIGAVWDPWTFLLWQGRPLTEKRLYVSYALSIAGALVTGLSVLLGLWRVVQTLAGVSLGQRVPGTAIVVAFFAGVQLLSLGLIGEYVGRIYDEVKRRPMFIVDRKVNF